jgi:hypothetical protein
VERVDIIRRADGPDNLGNLRSLRVVLDNQIKGHSSGKRENDGQADTFGCDVNGWPLEMYHRSNRTHESKRDVKKFGY